MPGCPGWQRRGANDPGMESTRGRRRLNGLSSPQVGRARGERRWRLDDRGTAPRAEPRTGAEWAATAVAQHHPYPLEGDPPPRIPPSVRRSIRTAA